MRYRRLDLNLLVALDLERLRGEFVLRAAGRAFAEAEAT